jgi:acyl-CoA synthetase (AMP-forming)/AMP-acid ligase II
MLGGVVGEAARRFGERPAVVAPSGWMLTYEALDRISDELAAGLHQRGLRTGDVLALALPSSPEYLLAYIAAAKLGAITAGINPRLADEQRRALLDVAGPRLVLGTPDLLAGAPGDHETVEIALAETADEALRNLRSDAPHAPASADPQRPVAVVFTSGTSGIPKGVVFTEGHLDAITKLDIGGRRDGGGPMLASTELVHVGVMTKLAWYLRIGSTLHLLQRWRAGDALRVISRQRMTSVGAIAPQVALMLRHPDFDAFDLRSVATIVAGGAPSPPALVAEARDRFGAAYSIRYSSTESGGVGTATAFDAPDDEALHTVGRPRPGVAVTIRDDEGRTLPPEEVGTIWLRSPAVMAGYWRNAAATSGALVAGWLRTPDLGCVDHKGRLVITGRHDDAYVRGGYNVHPEVVEAALRDHARIAEVAVIPRPEAVLGEVGVAVVVPRPGGAPVDLDELRRHAAGRLAHHELPEALLLVDELPRTAVDKIDRRALRSLVAAPRQS